MRIISGILKGRSIKFLRNFNTRPLKDNVRESIFNILKHSSLIKTKIESSNIIDLYSGTGSFGIECISRGAEKVTFIENDIKAVKILKENLVQLSIINKTKIHRDMIEHVLTKVINDKFDIFFLDPPFKDLEFLENLKEIQKKKIFKKNHIVIIHREIKSKDNFEDILQTTETKKYGRSKIFFSVFK